MEAAQARQYLEQLGNGWELAREPDSKGGSHDLLRKIYRFKNFREALAFTNRIGEVAEEQNHHPDLHLAWGRVTIEIWTHKIAGLTESDFIFAAKCEELSKEASAL